MSLAAEEIAALATAIVQHAQTVGGVAAADHAAAVSAIAPRLQAMPETEIADLVETCLADGHVAARMVAYWQAQQRPRPDAVNASDVLAAVRAAQGTATGTATGARWRDNSRDDAVPTSGARWRDNSLDSSSFSYTEYTSQASPHFYTGPNI